MISGILVGLLFMAARESYGADSAVWTFVNKLLCCTFAIYGIDYLKSALASFVLPLGMTINMDGTAIMQVVAAMM